MKKPRIACVVGTRPDAIKTAPVVLELMRRSQDCEALVVSTGQHREMLDQVFEAFGFGADIDLGLLKPGQSLAEFTARAITGLDQAMEELRPDWVMAQGDTTTTFAASLAAFYRQVPFGHIEAGLRTGDLLNPFPEEFNRRACAIVAAQHYAPTEWSAENLRQEGFSQGIHVTGNTGIDAVLQVADREEQTWLTDWPGRVILFTSHRRENWGSPMQAAARAARRIVEAFPDAALIVPLHLNPSVRETLRGELEGHERIHLIEPPEYPKFVKLLQRSTLILSDSGGVQEEAPAFGVPVLVMRLTTERPEGIDAGCAELVGTDEMRIFARASELLSDPESLSRMARAASPYGDGRAAKRIVDLCLAAFA
jgi:UDP-N-acetylglucosamine 2-epimerase